MKIAYIVQCHKNAQQVNKLIDLLSYGDNDIYLHIDKKNTTMEKEITLRPQLYILPQDKRINVKWGHISIVQSALSLIRSVLDSKIEYDYVWLISGQDFPLMSSEAINQKLQEENGTAFIDIMPTDSYKYQRFLKRNEVWTAQWTVGKNIFTRCIRNFWYLMTGGKNHTFKIFRRKINNAKFYFGSAWWALPYVDIVKMIDYLDKNPYFYKFYSHCHCSDESFFQTLFMNFCDHNGDIKDILSYIDWSNCKNSPKTFTMENLNQLLSARDDGYLMARKFDMSKDSQIINELEHIIRM